MGLGGKWYSAVGSELTLIEDGNELSGTFHSVQAGGAPAPVHGSAISAIPGRLNRPLSFSVAWPVGGTYPPSVTSYTGQYHGFEGPGSPKEFIDVVFLLANGTPPEKDYASVFVGHDVFTRERLPDEAIEAARLTRHPLS